MIRTFVLSVSDFVNKRMTNPFLGTYIFVWVFRHWELIFTLFNFAPNESRKARLDIIKDLLKDHTWYDDLGRTAFFTIILLVLGLVMINLARFFLIFSEYKARPWIQKFISSNSVLTKKDSENLKLKYAGYEKKIEELERQLAAFHALPPKKQAKDFHDKYPEDFKILKQIHYFLIEEKPDQLKQYLNGKDLQNLFVYKLITRSKNERRIILTDKGEEFLEI